VKGTILVECLFRRHYELPVGQSTLAAALPIIRNRFCASGSLRKVAVPQPGCYDARAPLLLRTMAESALSLSFPALDGACFSIGGALRKEHL
jgi:hypothetical protein